MYDVIWDQRENSYVVRHVNLRSGRELFWAARQQGQEKQFANEAKRSAWDRINARPVIMIANVESYAKAIRCTEVNSWPRLGAYA